MVRVQSSLLFPDTDIVRNINDPEHPLTLEQLNVTQLQHCYVCLFFFNFIIIVTAAAVVFVVVAAAAVANDIIGLIIASFFFFFIFPRLPATPLIHKELKKKRKEKKNQSNII